MIVGITMKNYGLLQDFQLGLSRADLLEARAQERVPLGSLQALIGPNSSGKSSIFEGLAFMRDILLYGVGEAAVLADRGGFARLQSDYVNSEQAPLSLALLLADPEREEETDLKPARPGVGGASEASPDYRPQLASNYYYYRLDLKADRHHRPYLAGELASHLYLTKQGWQEKVLLRQEGYKLQLGQGEGRQTFQRYETKIPGLAYWGLDRAYPDLHFILQSLRGIFVYRLSTDKSQTRPEEGGHKHLKERRDNLQNVLSYMAARNRSAYDKWLRESLSKIPQYLDKHKKFSLAEMSTGELKLFEIMVLLQDSFSLLCLDEPDVSLYYPMMEVLIKEMRDYSLRNPASQIFFTTHNSGLLQALRPEEVWLLTRPGQKGAQARTVAFDPVVQAMYKEGLDMGMLWYGGYLDQLE